MKIDKSRELTSREFVKSRIVHNSGIHMIFMHLSTHLTELARFVQIYSSCCQCAYPRPSLLSSANFKLVKNIFLRYLLVAADKQLFNVQLIIFWREGKHRLSCILRELSPLLSDNSNFDKVPLSLKICVHVYNNCRLLFHFIRKTRQIKIFQNKSSEYLFVTTG